MNKKELDNYRIVSTPSADGKRLIRTREYIGPRYTLLLDAEEQRKLTVEYIAASVGGLILHVAAALWQVPSNVSGAVGGIALMAMVPLLFTAFGALNGLTVKNGMGMERGKFRATSEYRRYGALIACLMLACCFVACAVFTVAQRESVPLGQELAMCAEYLLVCLACFWVWRTERRLPYDKSAGQNGKT